MVAVSPAAGRAGAVGQVRLLAIAEVHPAAVSLRGEDRARCS